MSADTPGLKTDRQVRPACFAWLGTIPAKTRSKRRGRSTGERRVGWSRTDSESRRRRS
jgi:hypothetical protein